MATDVHSYNIREVFCVHSYQNICRGKKKKKKSCCPFTNCKYVAVVLVFFFFKYGLRKIYIMEIFRGSLDDISRPASSEPHSDRICATTTFSLLVLTNEAADIQVESSSEETPINSSGKGNLCIMMIWTGRMVQSLHVVVLILGQRHVDVTEEENEKSKLHGAVEEMRRLDEILMEKICKEKDIRRQRKELVAKLWRELLNKPEGHSESAHEALNTRLFLALEAPAGAEEEEDGFVPVFGTQVPDQRTEQSEKKPYGLTESLEGSYEDTGEDQFTGSHCGTSKGMNKHKDFVKRNIELVSGEGAQMLLTQEEKGRLAELLRELDEEEEDSARGAEGEETTWAVSVLTGQGYTPEPSDLEQLIDIDSKIRLLLPIEEFHSVQSSYTNLSMSQGPGSEDGWKCDGDVQPGEKVLQDIKERRGQERRLQEIQQQLETLVQGHEMTIESPELSEEQLLSRLVECELSESWSYGLEADDTTPRPEKKQWTSTLFMKT
ncbi:fibrous sheath-interacting protein 1 isoform X2 [Embiotoca jacksoni]|uniref:fibrous sheath-interacting protein 1 isoform X2 n=1 Tax=Embiotoca jacksoni TaxID=100190 RepID=UPI0037041511